MIKTLYLSLLTSLFMLAVANYPQEAIVQLPTSLVSYIFFAAGKCFSPFLEVNCLLLGVHKLKWCAVNL